MALSVCLRKLEKATNIEDRIPIYKFLQSKKRLPALCSDEKYILLLTTLLLKDISSNTNKVLQLEALHTLQSCLSCDHLAESLNSSISQEMTTIISDQARTTEHPELYTEFICSLSQLTNVMPETIATKLPEILECLERHFVKQYAPYVDVLCKVCHLFQRLITEIADSMIPHIKVWTPWVFFPLCHENNEVRDLAMKNLELCLPVFLMMEKTVLPLIVCSVKSHLAKEMTMLYPNQTIYVLKLWGTLVTALGIALHRGSSFINTLLEIIEKAFRSEDELIYIEAFNVWKHLISNFATNLDVIGNSKRLKLLLQPLKLNFLSTERVALAKCSTWWHIIWSLGDKLNSNFELVCTPLLQYAFSSPLKNVDVASTSPAATRSGVKQSSKSSVTLGPKSNNLQKLGCEILCRLLEQPKWGSPGGLHSPKKIPNISLMPLTKFISSSAYVQHISTFMHAAKLAMSTFGQDDSSASLNQYILQLLTSRSARLANDKDESSAEAISEYFHFIAIIVVNKHCKVSHILKLLDYMKMFRKEQLLTQILHVDYKGKRCNTPLLVIFCVIFEPEILDSSLCSDQYFSSFNHFLSVSQGMLAPLSFIASVMEMLKERSPEFSNHPKILCKVWSCVCLHLLEIIEKTQEVNQGSNSSCDFTSTTMVLAYPVQHFLTYDVMQVCDKQLWRNWSDLYKAFARCSALVPSAEANTACELVAKMMQANVSKKNMQDCSISSVLFQLMETMVDCIDYSALGKEFSELSPSNWCQREERPLHNITSFMSLLGNLLTVFSKLIEESQGTERKKDNKQLMETTSSLINITRKLIVNVTTSSLLRALILKLLPFLVPIFSCLTKKQRYSKTYNAQFQKNVEALWSAILTGLQLHYSGPYDSEFLESICPLLEANLLNSHQNNVERTRQFWHATFGCNLHNLILPTSFKKSLKKVRPPLLPDIEVSPVEDTSCSLSPAQMADEEAQSDKLNASRNSSVRKSTGIADCQFQPSLSKRKQGLVGTVQHPSPFTCLNSKKVSESSSTMRKSKDKPVTTPSKNLLENSNEKFVLIEPQKKKRVLTEHQKEMRKRRSHVPAMYNDLSQQTIDIDSQSLSESSQALSSQKIETSTIPSTEDSVCKSKIQDKDKNVNQEPVVIVLGSEEMSTKEMNSSFPGAIDSLNSDHSIEDKNSSKILPSVTSNEDENNEAVPTSLEVPLVSRIISKKSSDSKDVHSINKSVNCRKEKSYLQERNLNQTNIIEETESATTQNFHISGNISTSNRLLVEDKAKDPAYLTPVKQGVLRLVKNKNRLSTLFPKLSHMAMEVESDLDEEDAIPSSQDSPITTNSVDKSMNTGHQMTPKKILSHSEGSNNDSLLKSVPESDLSKEENKISQSSEALLSEIGRISSKGSSEESVKIISNCAVKSSETKKPLCPTIDLTEDTSLKDEENVDSYKEPVSLSQDISDCDVLENMQFSISSNNEFQPSIEVIGGSDNSSKSDDDIHLSNKDMNNSPKFVKSLLNSPEPKRRSLRRLTPTRRIQEALLTKNRRSMNYKELLQSRNKSSSSRQQHESSTALEKLAEDIPKDDDIDVASHETGNHNFDNQCQHSVILNEKKRNSSTPPMINRELFPETNSPLNDLLTKPLTADCLAEKVHLHDDIGKVKLMECSMKQSLDVSVFNADESNNNVPSTNNWLMFKDDRSVCTLAENIDSKILTGKDQHLVNQSKIESSIEYSDPEMLLKENSSPQSEQEQTPELKSPLPSAVTFIKHSQRQKPNKVGKLKSIELEKLFSETEGERKSINEYSADKKTEVESLEAFIGTSFEKPKGARKRKCKTPSPASNQTSPVATRLRARSSAAKQRAMQKSRLRGRPKSRSSSLGIAHRHKPKRLSSVSIKSPTKIQPKDEEKVTTNKILEKEENLDTTEVSSPLKNEECGKLDDPKKICEEELNQDDKVLAIETKTPDNVDMAGRDEKTVKSRPDPSRKRPLTDIKNCRAVQRSFNLPISPLSRSQKILRAAIGNFPTIEKSAAWKANKYCGSPKHVNTMQDNSSPDSSKFSSYRAKQLSPTASPSTGILKKRRMMDDDNSNTSPSPQQKQRKVSFADPIVQSSVSIMPCNVNERPSRPVNRCLEMPKSLSIAEKTEMDTSSPSESSLQTSEEYQITPAAYYDANEKVFPDLESCNEPVEGVLPYLTCSLFPSGLGQLLRARNIFTIGDLCLLTIPELLRLPVRSPKLETVRKALKTYLETYQKEKVVVSTKESIKEQKETLESGNSPKNKESLDMSEAESDSMKVVLVEEQNYVNESVYVDDDNDMPLTPMPDSDSEDSFLSCNENSQRSQMKSLSDLHETQNVGSNDTTVENESCDVPQNSCNEQESVRSGFSTCDYSVDRSADVKTRTDNRERDLTFISDSSVCIDPNSNMDDKQESQMETSLDVKTEDKTPNCEGKVYGDTRRQETSIEISESSDNSLATAVIHVEVTESIRSFDVNKDDSRVKQVDRSSSDSLSSDSSVFSMENNNNLVEQQLVGDLDSHIIMDNESKAEITVSGEEGSKTDPGCAVEELHETDHSGLKSNLMISVVEVKSIQSASCEQYTDAINEQLQTAVSTADLEKNVSLPITTSETGMNSMQDDSCEQHPDCAVKSLHNVVSDELETSNSSNVQCLYNAIKSLSEEKDLEEQCQNFMSEHDSHITSSDELEINSNSGIKDSEIEGSQNSFITCQNCASETADDKSEESIDNSNLSVQSNTIKEHPECADDYGLDNTAVSQLEPNIDICNATSETECKQDCLDEHTPDRAIVHSETEAISDSGRSSELCNEDEKSGQDSLIKQQEMESETALVEINEHQVSGFTGNMLMETTEVESNIPSRDTQDIAEIVNILVGDVVNEEMCEKDVKMDDLLPASASICEINNSTKFQVESKKLSSAIQDQEIMNLSDHTTFFDNATDDRLANTNMETMAPSEDGDSTISCPRKDENIIEQTELDVLQSLFTTENLREASLMHLVDMMDKLTAAIRIKSQEISHPSNYDSH